MQFDDSDFIFGISLKSEPRKHINIHSKGDKPDMKIPSSDPPSVHQIGLDDVLHQSENVT
jgi:hypothetical protein